MRPPKKTNVKDPFLKASIPLTTPNLKIKDVVDLIEDAAKKPRVGDAPFTSQSTALHHFGLLTSVYIKDEEVKEWKAMGMEDATRASIKASAQLLFHSTYQVEKMILERARLTRLESENSDILRKLKDNDNKYK